MKLPYDVDRAQTELTAADPLMAQVIEIVGPCRMTLKRPKDPFRALMRSIVHQQLSVASAHAIETRLLDSFANARPDPAALLSRSDKNLRDIGLSKQKISYVRDLAAKTLAGELPGARSLARFSDDEIVEKFIAVKGVGRWTVEMMLIFYLGRPDVLPVDDFGVRKGFMLSQNRKQMPEPKKLTRYGVRWAPWRSVASWYLWRVAEQGDPLRVARNRK